MSKPGPSQTLCSMAYKGYDIRTDVGGLVWIYHQNNMVAGPVTREHASSLVDDYVGKILVSL